MSIFTLIKNIIRIFEASQKSNTVKHKIVSKGKDDSEFELKWFETDEGRGFVVHRISDGQRLQWATLSKSDGFESVPIAGVSHRKKALQDPSFAPGKALQIRPEPENPYDSNALGVWNEEMTLQVGYLPKEYSAWVAEQGLYFSKEKVGCMSMWEVLEGKKRVALRCLIVYEGAKIRGISFK